MRSRSALLAAASRSSRCRARRSSAASCARSRAASASLAASSPRLRACTASRAHLAPRTHPHRLPDLPSLPGLLLRPLCAAGGEAGRQWAPVRQPGQGARAAGARVRPHLHLRHLHRVEVAQRGLRLPLRAVPRLLRDLHRQQGGTGRRPGGVSTHAAWGPSLQLMAKQCAVQCAVCNCSRTSLLALPRGPLPAPRVTWNCRTVSSISSCDSRRSSFSACAAARSHRHTATRSPKGTPTHRHTVTPPHGHMVTQRHTATRSHGHPKAHRPRPPHAAPGASQPTPSHAPTQPRRHTAAVPSKAPKQVRRGTLTARRAATAASWPCIMVLVARRRSASSCSRSSSALRASSSCTRPKRTAALKSSLSGPSPLRACRRPRCRPGRLWGLLAQGRRHGSRRMPPRRSAAPPPHLHERESPKFSPDHVCLARQRAGGQRPVHAVGGAAAAARARARVQRQRALLRAARLRARRRPHALASCRGLQPPGLLRLARR
jgi:hypothetical protein